MLWLKTEQISSQQLLFCRKWFTDFNMLARKKKKAIYSQLNSIASSIGIGRDGGSSRVVPPRAGFLASQLHHLKASRFPGTGSEATVCHPRAALNFPLLTTRQDVFWRVFNTRVVCFQDRQVPEQKCPRKHYMLGMALYPMARVYLKGCQVRYFWSWPLAGGG